jgi:hypothetical protein
VKNLSLTDVHQEEHPALKCTIPQQVRDCHGLFFENILFSMVEAHDISDCLDIEVNAILI